MWINGLLSRPPASSSSTRHRPDSLSRPATAQPADPAPVTIKSKVSFAVVILCSPKCEGNDSEAKGHREGPRPEAAALRQAAEVGRAAGDRVDIAVARLTVHGRGQEAGGVGVFRCTQDLGNRPA